MRIIIALLTALSCLTPAVAQAQDRDESPRSLTKIVIGAGALAIGTAIAAKSSQTTTVSSAVGTSETSTFSTSQLVTGLAVAGVGGIVLWDGLRSHESTRRSTMIGAGVGRHVQSVFVRHTW
jgi:hypothetical protein